MRTHPTLGLGKSADFGLLARLGLILDEVRAQGSDKLPSEAELCRRLEVDRPRLHRLLLTLSRDGVVLQVRSKGWFFPSPKLEIPVARHNSYTATMVRQNRQPRSEVVGIDQEKIEGRWAWVLHFRRYDGGLAFSLARIEVPLDLTPGLNLHLGPNVSLYEVLERHYGIRPERQHTWCEAVAADAVVADALGVPLGSVLLKTTHEAHWQGRPFESTINFLRADACRVRIDLAVTEVVTCE